MKKILIVMMFLVGITSAFILFKSNTTETTTIQPTDMGRTIQIKMETSMGDVMLEIYPDHAPLTVNNFLSYINTGAYEGTIFHRIIKGFMNQGGGFTANYEKKETQAPIANEAFNGLKNSRGSIAMARTSPPHSATSQFFINTVDNPMLDHTGKSARGWGYAVFGKVITGMDVIDNMANVETGLGGPFAQDAPQQAIIILKMSEVKTEN